MNDDQRHVAVAAKWDELRDAAREHGTPIIIRFFDGESEVVAFGGAKTREVFVAGGGLGDDGSIAGEVLIAFDADTLTRLLPTPAARSQRRHRHLKGGVMNTIIVCGGRNYSDAARVDAYLSRLTKPFRIVAGGCSGADLLAQQWAERNGVECVVVPADWKAHGKAAGPMRNAKMLAEFDPCAVVAFPGGRGTRNMKDLASKAGVPVYEPVLEAHAQVQRWIT